MNKRKSVKCVICKCEFELCTLFHLLVRVSHLRSTAPLEATFHNESLLAICLPFCVPFISFPWPRGLFTLICTLVKSMPQMFIVWNINAFAAFVRAEQWFYDQVGGSPIKSVSVLVLSHIVSQLYVQLRHETYSSMTVMHTVIIEVCILKEVFFRRETPARTQTTIEAVWWYSVAVAVGYKFSVRGREENIPSYIFFLS